jgi:hypothetical protein
MPRLRRAHDPRTVNGSNYEYIGNSLQVMSALHLCAAMAEQSARKSDQGNRKVLSRLQSLRKAKQDGEMNKNRG